MDASGHYQMSKRAIQELMKYNPSPAPMTTSGHLTWELLLHDFAVNPPTSGDDPIIPGDTYGAKHFGIPAIDAVWEYYRSESNAPNAVKRYTNTNNINCLWGAVHNPADGSIAQDLEDCLDHDHWRDEPDPQHVHFMRASAELPIDAHWEAVKLIRKQLSSFVSAMSMTIEKLDGSWKPYGGRLTQGKPSEHLGRALHTTQDSFSPAHAKRSDDGVGPVRDIYCYRQQEESHVDHEGIDHQWFVPSKATGSTGRATLGTPAHLSAVGQRAVDASMDLIKLALQLAAAKIPPDAVDEQPLWTQFREQHFPFISF